jgi:hypothetical protein
MLRDVFSKLSGGNIAAIIIAAILAPTAVYAVAPALMTIASITGVPATVDAAHRLWVYDTVEGVYQAPQYYRNNPANFVDITVTNHGFVCETSQQYVIPAGKALVMTAISGYTDFTTDLTNISGVLIYDGAGCTGKLLTTYLSTVRADLPFSPVNASFGQGIAVKAGKTVSVFSNENNGYTFIHGYLVPASAVPAASLAEAALEPKPITSAEVMAKMKARAVH